MKYFNIPPAAACVIALTSVTCFGQDQRDLEETEAVSSRVAAVSPSGQNSRHPASVHAERKIGGIYLVEVELGNRTREVLIDAHTGGILRQRDVESHDT